VLYTNHVSCFRAGRRHGTKRRDQLTHPAYQKPELLAVAPNQLGSWDITKLRGPAKWTYFYLYVILDVFSRYVVGWMVALREGAGLASKLLEEKPVRSRTSKPTNSLFMPTAAPPMRSKPVAFLLADLSITKTHSRPYTSNDNPLFRKPVPHHEITAPEFPDRFGCLQDSRAFCHRFFALVQRRPSSFRNRHDVARPWCTTAELLAFAKNRQLVLDGRLCRSSRALRAQAARSAATSQGGLDQQTPKLRTPILTKLHFGVVSKSLTRAGRNFQAAISKFCAFALFLLGNCFPSSRA